MDDPQPSSYRQRLWRRFRDLMGVAVAIAVMVKIKSGLPEMARVVKREPAA